MYLLMAVLRPYQFEDTELNLPLRDLLCLFSAVERLGSGCFGDVHLADAVGIVCFHPREKASMKQKPLFGRRWSRSVKKSPRPETSQRLLVTKVAVKKLKGSICYTVLV